MELTQLLQFKVLAETKNITKASELLFVTQPAITKSVKKLEEELGVELFDRSTRKLILNKYGKIVLSSVNMMSLIIDEMKEQINYAEFNSDLRVLTPLRSILGSIIPIYIKNNPNVNVLSQYKTNYFKEYLIEDMADVTITDLYLDDDLLESIFLFEDDAGISVPINSAIAQRNVLHLSDLNNKTVLRCTRSLPLAKSITQKIEENNIRLHEVYQEDIYLYMETSKRTDYYVFCSTFSNQVLNLSKSRKYIPFSKDDGLSIKYYASFLKKNREKVIDFIEWITEYINEILS